MKKPDSQELAVKKLTLTAWARIFYRKGMIDAARLSRMAHIFRLWDLRITQAFDAPSANLELCDFNLRRFGRRSFSLTLLRDALNIIISKIVNWLGAVIAQSGRQFDESGDCFFGDDVV